MNDIYPAGPASIPENITKASSAYKRHAWLAMMSLLLFVVIYVLMIAWFTWTAYDLLTYIAENNFDLIRLVAGICAAFLAVFMTKAFFFINRSGESNDMEVTKENQPRLYEFLYKLADEAGAPRPHRVFLSARVNACVFYDLSVLNLFFPSKKNLEIGLPLVNCLNLGEVKAVLAHEFGHFAQKTMAVGRWVYIAQQIAAHIINKRDAFDSFLKGLSRTDIRIAWIGWALRIVIWSIRSLMETIFGFVIMAQRALSREMEFQADLVAVSLTGSDALIHALHKLEAADDSWERTLNFANSELREGKVAKNLFEVQTEIINHLRNIFDDQDYGKEPELPSEQPESHRVFKKKLAQPPKMWATHPENTAREENAKNLYVAAKVDQRSGWSLFNESDALQHKMSLDLVEQGAADVEKTVVDDSKERLDQQYQKITLNPKYRGAYLGRSAARNYSTSEDMYVSIESLEAKDFLGLYPVHLAESLEQLRNLNEDKYYLKAVKNGTMKAYGGVVRFRGKELQASEFSEAIEQVNDEIKDVQASVDQCDKYCRSAHRKCAHTLGKGWEEYITAKAKAVHYAQHTQDDLQDVQGVLINVWNVIWADGNVSGKEIKRLVLTCNQVHASLHKVYEDAKNIDLDKNLLSALEIENWQKALGEFDLPPAHKDNINDWMKVIDGWVGSTVSALSHLRQVALEQLLETEDKLAKAYLQKTIDEAAPAASVFPSQYKTLMPGQERELQTKLGLWDSFQTASGMGAAIARTLVSLSIVGAVLGGGLYLSGVLL